MTAQGAGTFWRMRGTLLLAGLATAALMIHGGATGRVWQVSASAAAFAFVAVLAAILCSRGGQAHTVAGNPNATAAFRDGLIGDALACPAYLGAIAYGWGALAMQGLYLTPLTGLKWQHGWQYASAMALLCAGSLAFIRAVRPGRGAASGADRPASASALRLALPLAIGQGLVAGVGLMALVASGKLGSIRADWAANRVFAGLAVAILAVAAATMLAHARWRGRA